MKLRNMIEGCADLQNEWYCFALLETLCSVESFFPDNEVVPEEQQGILP